MVLSQESKYKRSGPGWESVEGVEGEGAQDKGDKEGGNEKGRREDGEEK